MSPELFPLSEILSGIGLNLEVNLVRAGVYVEPSQLGKKHVSTFTQYVLNFIFPVYICIVAFSSSRVCAFGDLISFKLYTSSLKMNWEVFHILLCSGKVFITLELLPSF